MRYFFIITALLTFFSNPAHSALVTFKYDPAGNMVSEQGKYYEYNDANQLIRVRKDSASGEILAEYVYDYQGQRVKKVENGVTTYYIGKHYEVRKGATVDEKTSYFFANSQRIAKSSQKNKAPPEVSYYLNNHLGSADVIIDENGKVLDNIKYLPFGGYRTYPQERHTFTGKERDEVTDNYYFEARYYNSNIRRFTQADTIVPDLYDPQSLNRYAYARNSPVVYVDPSGHIFFAPLIAGIIVAWPAIEVGLLAVDAVNTAVVLLSPKSTEEEKALTVEMLRLSAVLPGGGYTFADDIAEGVAKGKNLIKNPVIGKPRVGSANKLDGQHSFPDIVDNYAGEAEMFNIPTKGQGGVVDRQSQLYQLKGYSKYPKGKMGFNNPNGNLRYNEKEGIFEWIVDEGQVTHRRFIPDGEITGYPNQCVQ